MSKKAFTSTRILEKVIGISIIGMIVYFTGALSVLGGFFRTLTPGSFDTPASANVYQYGYGYGNGTWGYGYGYGYNNTFGGGYGTTLSDSTNPYYAMGYRIGSAPATQPAAGDDLSFTGSTETVSTSSTLSGTTITTVFSNVGATSTTTIKKVEIPAQVVLTGTVTGIGNVGVDIPAGTNVYANTGTFNSIPAPSLNAGVSTADGGLTISASSYTAQGKPVQLGIPGVSLVFDKVVTVNIPGVTVAPDKVVYSIDGSTWHEISQCATASTDPVFPGECYWYYPDTDVLRIKTFHFTTFTAATVSSTSASGGGGGGGGTVSQAVQDAMETEDTVEKVTDEKVEEIVAVEITRGDAADSVKDTIGSITFKTSKFKKIVPLINNIVYNELEKAELVALITENTDLLSSFSVGYVNFVKSLYTFESDENTITDAKSALSRFLVSYGVYKRKLAKVAVSSVEAINNTNVTFVTPIFNDSSLTKVVNLINDKFIAVLKAKGTSGSLLKETLSEYNNFILAIKVMKEGENTAAGKTLAKKYLTSLVSKLKEGSSASNKVVIHSTAR